MSEPGRRIEDYDYPLPKERIAQEGASPRDHSRLMVVERGRGVRAHARFFELPRFLRAGDLIVFNETKVIPARIFGVKEGGARVEALLVREEAPERWWAMVRPGRRLRPGARVRFGELTAEVAAVDDEGLRLLVFSGPVRPLLERLGRTPLPPYIHRPVDPERYQTVYASREGSVAAPTAGLHFTPRLLEVLEASGIEQARVVLHVGPGTFQAVKGTIEAHRMHAERYEVPAEAAARVNCALAEGRRVIAVGTTVVRTLEAAFVPDEGVRPGSGETRLFIRPPYRFQVVGGLVTNFHLPRSTLLMLVAAFAGYEVMRTAYREALAHEYRFFSLGDAMLIL